MDCLRLIPRDIRNDGHISFEDERSRTHASACLRKISDIVNAGLAGLHIRLIHTTPRLIAMNAISGRDKPAHEVVRALAFFLGMERMLSDQALKQGHLGDALAHTGDEGRSTLR